MVFSEIRIPPPLLLLTPQPFRVAAGLWELEKPCTVQDLTLTSVTGFLCQTLLGFGKALQVPNHGEVASAWQDPVWD